jgi:hypothetical protein
VRVLVALLFALCAALVGCGAPEVPPPSFEEPPVAGSVAQPRPVRVEIPDRGVDGPILPEGLGVDETGGHLEPPVERPELASWYNLGPRPGAPGPSVVLGHVNGGGKPGIFANLEEVERGDRVVVGREDGTWAEFEVYRISTILKDQFPTDEVYGPTQGAEIRLITCGGDFNRATGHYRSNILVFARLTQII